MRHHYLPRFQLNYFAIPECHRRGGDPKVVAIPLDGRPTFVASTRNVACQHEMYAIDEFDDPQTVEKRFALNLWIAERANVLITGRQPDEVLRELDPWIGSGPPQFYEIRPA